MVNPASLPRPVLKADVWAALPAEWHDPALFAAIQQQVRRSDRRIVVLDDDPTGTQTVHDVNILTEWSVSQLSAALRGNDRLFYILTNSRSLPPAQSRAIQREIASHLAQAARASGCEFVLISRSDSTLRGHYPLEIDTLAETLQHETGVAFDGQVLIPFFPEGGRFTIQDVHWVQEGEKLVPAAQTEYARDPAFGYSASNLRDWVAEKTAGRFCADQVISISLDTLRHGGPPAVANILSQVRGFTPVIVNCASYSDVEVFVAGCLQAEAAGKRFLFRTAAAFVKVRGGITDQPLLTAAQLVSPGGPGQGGLVVVGSYIQKSSAQLDQLLALDGLRSVELNVAHVLNPATRAAEIATVAAALNQAIADGQVALVYTSREHVPGLTRHETLQIAQNISDALVGVVRAIHITPRFIVAKGGITSSDTATKGLGVRVARVLGQVAPGVAVWRLGAESRFPGTPYIIFPGNVGSAGTLAEVVCALRGGSEYPAAHC